MKNAHYNKLFYQIELRDPLQPERLVLVEVEVISAHELTPYTKEILQKEKQLVKYTGNFYFFSPYSLTKQTTIRRLSGRRCQLSSARKTVPTPLSA